MDSLDKDKPMELDDKQIIRAALEKVLRILHNNDGLEEGRIHWLLEDFKPNDMYKALNEVVDTLSFNMSREEYLEVENVSNSM